MLVGQMSDQGKAPKSKEAIRSRLEKISQTANVKRESGPNREGAGADGQVVIGSFYDRSLGKKLQAELSSRGLFSESITRARKFVVLVDHSDVKEAGEIYQVFREQHPDPRPVHAHRRYDFLIFGAVIGFTFAVLGFFAKDCAVGIEFLLLPVALGATGGHLLDQLGGLLTPSKTHWAAFSIWTFSLVVAILAMTFCLMQLLPALVE